MKVPNDTMISRPVGELDGDNRKSSPETGKASYLDAVAKASQGTTGPSKRTLDTVVPSMPDAPKGEIKLGEKAGAFGPWRAHQVIDGTAKKIAESAAKLPAVPDGSRVLVVDDRSVLPSDWTAQYVQSSLDRLHARVVDLADRIGRARQELDAAIARYEREQGTPAPEGGEEPVSRRRGPGRDVTAQTAGGATAGAVGATPGGLGAAVSLLDLLRTDYAVTATAVSASASELATLTAGHLAAQQATGPAEDEAATAKVTVEADVFATMSPSPVSNRFADILRGRDRAVEDLSFLQARLAPVEAELMAVNTRMTQDEQTWATAVADKADDTAITVLRSAVDQAAKQASAREIAAGPARIVVAYAQQVIADVDTAAAALLKPTDNGEAPLFTAARRERLHTEAAARKVTHILYVNLDAIAADAVTRRSVLGTSGRIRFLSAGNASWLMLSTDTGTIAGGGQVSLADVMTFDMENGKAKFEASEQWLQSSEAVSADPLNALENWAKGLVIVLAIVLFALGFLSVLAVAKVALG